jgi:hypothetical protein
MPNPAFVRFAIAAFAAALLFAACGDGEPADTPAPSPSEPPSGTPTKTAPSTPGPTPTGAPTDAKLLSIERGGQFPPDTAIIVETGCWGCDGPTQSLVRVYQGPDGNFRRDTLLDPATLPYERRLTTASGVTHKPPLITGYVTSPDSSEIIVSVCVQETCGSGGLDAWSADSRTAFLRSTDGGITWAEWAAYSAGVQIELYLGPGEAIAASWDANLDISFRRVPGFERLDVPEGAAWPYAHPGGELVWTSMDGSRLLRSDGSMLLDFGAGTQVTGARWSFTSSPAHFVAVYVENAMSSRTFLAPVLEDGTVTETYYVDALINAGEELSDGVYIGNIDRDRFWPAIIDLNRLSVTLIEEPFAGPGFELGRTFVAGIQRGPFARVVNTGSCLNIRDGPSLESNVITCAADGVLLRDQGETVESDGVTWVRVVTPAGVEGWAAAAYLER